MSAAKSLDPRILIADNSMTFLQNLGRLLEKSGFNDVVSAQNCAQVLEELGSYSYNLAIIDLGPPPSGSLEVLRVAQSRGIATGIVVLTESGTIPKAVEAMKKGAQDYFAKPIDEESFIVTICSLIESTCRCTNILAARIDVYLREHLGTVGLKLEDVCRKFSISASYLELIFHDHHNSTFKRRLNLHRVEKAKQLLESTDDSISAIASKCGFRNNRRLAEVFKTAVGMPSTTYRRMARSRGVVGENAVGERRPPEK